MLSGEVKGHSKLRQRAMNRFEVIHARAVNDGLPSPEGKSRKAELHREVR